MANPTSTDTNGSQITIETPRLTLRAARISDVDDLFDCFRDEDVMRYWDTLPHANTDVTKKWLESMINGHHNGITDFVICLRSTTTSTNRIPDLGLKDTVQDYDTGNKSNGNAEDRTKVIGKVGVWHGSEIGFLLHRAYWGQGLACEAVREVLDLALDVHSHPTSSTVEKEPRKDVVADVDPRNEASLGLLKKLGFGVYATKEKTFEVGGVWVDSVYLSLKRETWMERRDIVV